MFRFSQDPLTTGEPPTPPLQSRLPASSDGFDPLQSRTTSDSTRTRSTQEQDSGYEASPCSVATNSCSSDLHFFGSTQPPANNDLAEIDNDLDDLSLTDDDDVFEETSFVLLEREDDWCRDCNATCPCTCRAESSATLRSTADLSTCDISHSSSESSSHMRPSSLPIRIPESTVVPVTNCPCSPRLSMSVPRSPPGIHPRTWPSSSMSRWNHLSPASIISAMLQTRLNRPIPRTAQGRRRLIDSDASDGNLSDDGDLDSPTPDAMSDDRFPSRVENLPDIILHSSPSNIRRNRSVSVSLPLETEVFRRIGRSLRRYSEQFERERGVQRSSCAKRRGTMDSNYRWPS